MLKLIAAVAVLTLLLGSVSVSAQSSSPQGKAGTVAPIQQEADEYTR